MSILLNDWATHETQQWFDGKQSKIESVAASILTAEFNHMRTVNNWLPEITKPYATFDARVFNIPKEDVCNYFLWRQQDASRNSVQMLGRMYFSHKEMHNKNNSQIQDMLMNTHGVNWNDLDTWKKRGCAVRRGVTGFDSLDNPYVGYVIDENIPIFSQDRQYIEQLL
jgi:tRNA(His) 5'-end guanylyltransferase